VLSRDKYVATLAKDIKQFSFFLFFPMISFLSFFSFFDVVYHLVGQIRVK